MSSRIARRSAASPAETATGLVIQDSWLSKRLAPTNTAFGASGSCTARSKMVIVGPHEDRVQLTSPDAHISAVKNRQREGVLQQSPERRVMIVAFDADDPQQIGDHPYCGFGTVDLGLDGKFFRGR